MGVDWCDFKSQRLSVAFRAYAPSQILESIAIHEQGTIILILLSRRSAPGALLGEFCYKFLHFFAAPLQQ